MKTLKLTNRILKNLTLAGLMVLTINVFADGDRKSANQNTKCNSTDLKEATGAEISTSSVMSAVPMNIDWIVIEFEEELEVLDIDSTYEMRPLWNREEVEFELEVEEFKPTEEVIPAWMIVEAEPELEVTDLTLN